MTDTKEYIIHRRDYGTFYQCGQLEIAFQLAAVNEVGTGNFSEWYTTSFVASK